MTDEPAGEASGADKFGLHFAVSAREVYYRASGLAVPAVTDRDIASAIRKPLSAIVDPDLFDQPAGQDALKAAVRAVRQLLSSTGTL